MSRRNRFDYHPLAVLAQRPVLCVEPPPAPPVFQRRRVVVVAEVIPLSDRKRWDRRRHNVLVAVFRRGISKQIRKGRR